MAKLIEHATTFPKPKYRLYRFLTYFFKLLYKKPQIINLAGNLPDKAIILANHSAKSGPPNLDLYYPKKSGKMGRIRDFIRTLLSA